MGGESAPSSGQTSTETLQQFASGLPAFANASLQTAPTLAAAQVSSAQNSSPQLNALQQLLYNAYGPQIAQTQNQIGNTAAAGSTQQTANQVNSPAASQVVQGAQNLAAEANPEYFNLIGNYANSLNKALGVLSPNLTGSQIAGIERQQGITGVQNGTANTPTATQTAANAANFGQQGQTQATNFANTLNSMVSGVGNFQTNPNTFAQTTNANTAGQAGISNASSIFQGSSPSNNAGSANSATSNNLLNTLFGNTESTTAAHPSQQFTPPSVSF